MNPDGSANWPRGWGLYAHLTQSLRELIDQQRRALAASLVMDSNRVGRYLPGPVPQFLECAICRASAHYHCYVSREVGSGDVWTCICCGEDFVPFETFDSGPRGSAGVHVLPGDVTVYYHPGPWN